MDFFKAVVLGAILTLVVCAIFHAAHSTGGYLHIFRGDIKGVNFYWSWTFFGASTALSWALLAMTPKD